MHTVCGMNSFRARICRFLWSLPPEADCFASLSCEQPGDYRFCNWGADGTETATQWSKAPIRCGSGKRPYVRNFLHHLRRSLGDRAGDLPMPDLEAEFHSDLARKSTKELGASGEEIAVASDPACAKFSVTLQLTRRTRYWTNGAMIGSK